MIRNRRKENVALSSVIASFMRAAMKLVVGIVTGSIGIISEVAHSGLDFGAVSLTYFAVKVSDKPADKEHQYGHTKVESVAALIETGVLLLTSAWIIYEAVHRLLSKTSEVRVAWYSVLVLAISIAVDFSRSRMLKKVAMETKSQAMSKWSISATYQAPITPLKNGLNFHRRSTRYWPGPMCPVCPV